MGCSFSGLPSEAVEKTYAGIYNIYSGIRLKSMRNYVMIMLTKLNNVKIVLNCTQIESVELIPESKVIMMNGKFFIVKESAEEIIEKMIEYNGRIHCYHTIDKE